MSLPRLSIFGKSDYTFAQTIPISFNSTSTTISNNLLESLSITSNLQNTISPILVESPIMTSNFEHLYLSIEQTKETAYNLESLNNQNNGTPSGSRSTFTTSRLQTSQHISSQIPHQTSLHVIF